MPVGCKVSWQMGAKVTVSAEALVYMGTHHTHDGQHHTSVHTCTHTPDTHDTSMHTHTLTTRTCTNMCTHATHTHTPQAHTHTCLQHSHQPLQQSKPSASFLAAQLDLCTFTIKYFLAMESNHACGEWVLCPSTLRSSPILLITAPQPE